MSKEREQAIITQRKGGQTKDGKWLVLTESRGGKGKGYIHSCGTQILGKIIIRPVWDYPELDPFAGDGRTESITIPFCPQCETAP